METATKSFPGQGKFDRNSSTYKHEIHLNNGYILTGYSKSLYFAEKQDKMVLLEDIILRLYHKGYLNRLNKDPKRETTKIIFYKQDIFSKDCQEVFTLYPTEYTFGKIEQYVLNDRINQFIKNFYSHINSNKALTDNIKHKPSYKMEDELFSTDKKRFNDFPQLIEFVNKCFKNGYEKGQVMGFYQKYSEKYF